MMGGHDPQSFLSGAKLLTATPHARAQAHTTLKILFVGDMHLGVLPRHLPAELVRDRRLEPHLLGPAAAWRRVVRAALEHQVHAVALAGDLVDSRNDLFEAYGPLEEGCRNLTNAGIPVIWTTFDVQGPAGLAARLVGWSFPRPHVETSPLAEAPPSAHPTLPTFGLLHADLDQATSRYAPVRTAELLSTGYRGWFLGHIHRPDTPRTDGHPFYLGSVVGRHPGETGARGPVLVELDVAGGLLARRLNLAPLRWENLDVPVGEMEQATEEELLPRLLAAVQNHSQELGAALDRTLAVGFRLRLTGVTPLAPQLRQALERLRAEAPSLVVDRGDTVLFIDRVTEDLAQPLDLADLARFPDPAGLLARRILVLEGGGDPVPGIEDADAERERLLRLGQEAIGTGAIGTGAIGTGAIGTSAQQSAFQKQGSALAPEEIRQRLVTTGRRALEEILATKEAGHAAD